MGELLIDRVAWGFVDLGNRGTHAFQDFPYAVVSRWIILNRGPLEELLKQQRVFAKPLDGLEC